MGLSVAQWETKVNALPNKDALRELIMETDDDGAKTFPEDNDWRNSKGWRTLIRMYMETEYNHENMDFLEDLDAFYLRTPGVGKTIPPTKQDLYGDYIREDCAKSINISADLRKVVAAALQGDDDSVLRDALDAADKEITELISSDPYIRFRVDLAPVQATWAETAEPGKPENVELDESPSTDELDKWNAKALKALSKNTPTDFFMSGVLVIVANPGAGAAPPGIVWMHQQPGGFVAGTVTKKGGVFSTATVLATGVRNKFDFEGALHAAAPDLVIEYPESSNEPKPKVSAFGRK